MDRIGTQDNSDFIINFGSGRTFSKIKTSMLCVSGGFNPDIHLFTQSKGLLKWDKDHLTFKPDRIFQKTITLGSVSGNFS